MCEKFATLRPPNHRAMKINFRTHPVLAIGFHGYDIEDDVQARLKWTAMGVRYQGFWRQHAKWDEGTLRDFVEAWNGVEMSDRAAWSDGIYIVSSEFLKAFYAAEDRLRELLQNEIEIIGNLPPMSGTYIVGDWIYFCRIDGERTCFFCINDSGDSAGVFMGNANDGFITYGSPAIQAMAQNIDANPAMSASPMSQLVTDMARFPMLLNMFMKYADVETVQMKPGAKHKAGGNKYKNELPFDITHLDSKWFREIVRNEAFKVSGHFKLQPCGEGLRERKLIYVNEYIKSGYHRKARVTQYKEANT